MHGHLLCVNGVILVVLSLPKVWRIPPSFCSIECVGWKRCCLKNKKMSVNFLTIFFESLGCMMHPIKFLLKRIFGFEEVVWKIPTRLFSAWPSLISEWNKWSTLSLFLAWPIQSSFCSWGDMVCHFPIGILGQVWYLIVSIPDLCNLTYFGGRFCLKNFKMAI